MKQKLETLLKLKQKLETLLIETFSDYDTTLDKLASHFLISCPRCSACARVLGQRGEIPPRLICTRCGVSKDWIRQSNVIHFNPSHSQPKPGEIVKGGAIDWYFHQPLWLQTPCCGRVLWAYNLAHVEWLDGFVSATQRKGRPHPEFGWSNRSMASRLPQWIQRGANRKGLLKGLATLREMAE